MTVGIPFAQAGWPPFDPLALLPGLALAAAALLLLLTGYRWGRRRAARTPRLLARALRQVAGGDYAEVPELPPEDPLAPAAEALRELAGSLAARAARAHELLGEALDGLDAGALLLLDGALTVRAASAGFARWLGEEDPARLRGVRAADLFTEESWAALLPVLTDDRKREARPVLALELRDEQASVRRLRAQALGPATRLALFLEPVPEQEGETAEEAASRLRSLVERLVDGLLVVAGGRVLEANRVAREWAGRDLAGAWLRDLVPAEDLLLVLDRVHRAARGEPVEPFRCRLQVDGGTLRGREVEAVVAPLRYGDRQAAALTLRDLGAERHAVRRARLQKARLLAVMDAVADGIVVLRAPRREEDPWRLSLVNRQARELFGDALRESGMIAVGAPEDELWSRVAPSFAAPQELVRFVREARERPGVEHSRAFDLPGAPVRSLELVFRPVHGSAGELVGRVLVLRDISRHREVERQLREDAAALERSRKTLQEAYEQLAAATRTLTQRGAELDRVNGELRDLDKAHLELLATVAHELQTPLVSIRGYAQMLGDGRLGRVNDEQRRGLERILSAVDRMVGLIENLLALVRAGGRPEITPQAVEVEPVVREVVERHAARAQAAGVRLRCEVAAPALSVLAERDGLVQVLDNLVSNGIKFNRRGGEVSVVARSGPEGYALIEVRDTGIGIDPADRERIFERFYRGKGAGKVSGSGIGLATVQAVVRRHGGKIRVESAPERGTAFRILWPRPGSGRGSEEPSRSSATS